MNVLQKKKRFLISIISTILSLVFVGYAYIENVQTVKADQLTYGIYTYQYGKMSYVTEPFTSANNTRWNFKTTLAFENNLYTSIDVAVTVNPLTNYTAILCENCNLTYINISSNLIVIRMRSAMTAKVEIYSPSNPSIVDAWNYGNPVTTYTDGNFDYDANMNTYIVRTEQHVETIEAYVGAVNRSIISLHDSLGYSASDTLKSTLNTIKTEIVASGVTTRAMLTKLNTLTDIDNKLASINANLNGLNLSNIDIKNNLESYFTEQPNVDNIYSWVVDIDDKLTQIVTTLNNINTSLSNINNTIDTISWQTYTVPTTMAYKKSSNASYTDWDGSSAISFSTGDIWIRIPTQATRYNRLYRLVFPLMYYNSSTNGGFNIDYIEISDNTNSQTVLYYTTGTQTQLSVYFTGNVSASASYLYLHFHSKSNTGDLRKLGNWNMYYLPNNNIEYWQLLSYFNQYEYNQKILDAINNVSIQVTQQDITNTNNNITNYNNTMNNIEGIETNIINNLNTDLSNLTITSDFVNPIDTNVRTAFDIVIQDFILDHNYIAGRFYLILICSLVLLMLGRW